jgi:hypothetical protein
VVRVLIDWDGDGYPAADGTIGALWPYTIDDLGSMTIDDLGTLVSIENATADVRATTPIVVKRGRDVARELAPFRAGTVDLLLGNEDGRYSSRNTASPLYGYVKAGRLIDVDVSYAGTTYDVAAAYGNEPEEQPLLQERSVRLYAIDGLGRAGAATVYSGMYTGITIDQAIGVVLDLIGWPTDLRDLDAAATTLARWWVGGITGFQAIRDLVLTEGPGAMLYVDGAGRVVFEGRHYRLLTARSTTSQATFRDQGTEPLMSRFAVALGEAGVVNSCTIPVRSYALGALGAVWTGPTPLTLGAGQVWTATVGTDADAFANAVDPTAGAGDFTVTAGAVASATLDRDGGKTATLTVTAGAGGATLTGLRVRAQVVTIAETLVSNTIDAGASVLDHGLQTLPSNLVPVWVPTVLEATDFCNAVVGRNKDGRAQVTVGVNNATDARLTQALERRISDRIAVVDTSPIAAFDDEATIEAVEYRFDSHGDVFEATFFCEEAVSQAMWVLGDPTLSILGESTVLGY